MNNDDQQGQLTIAGKPMSGQAHRPGMPCPQCGFFMEFSITSLLTQSDHVCAGCGLVLTMDRSASRGSMEALSQLQTAVENLNSVRNEYGGKR